MLIHYKLDDCGLFYYDGPMVRALPLEGVHVAARIVDTVAEVQVVQFYVNNTPRHIDTRYQFPLDESAAVCGFEAELDDKLLIGEVREKQEARAEYHAALARGETAALLEQDKPNMFTQRIGNIKPYSRVNIRVTYVADLKVESDGAVRFVLPTSVAPRYTPHWVPLTERPADYVEVPWRRHWQQCCLGRRVLYQPHLCYGLEQLPWHAWRYYTPEHVVDADRPCAFSLTVEMEMPSRVTNVVGSAHQVHWQLDADDADGHKAWASLWSGAELMGNDLVLSIYQHAAHAPHVELEVAPDGSGCAMLTMVPEFDIDPEPTEIIFLVDVSGSMRGQRMAAAIRALQLFLRSLPMTCHFNVYAFQSCFMTLFKNKGSEPYSRDTLQRALDYVRGSLRAFGGTELLPPLRDIFGRRLPRGRSRQLFVLTDGQVTNTADVIELCRQNAHNTRVFTVGIGEEVDRHLVEGMARAGNGTAEFIQGAELTSASGVLEGKLINQLKQATLPSISKLVVDWGELGAVPPADFFAASPPTMTAVTFRLRCEDVADGEQLCLVGAAEQLGAWDPSRAVRMHTNAHAFPVWAVTVALPSGGDASFKFVKRRADGAGDFETVDNRSITVTGSECTVECGAWNAAAPPQLTNVVAAPAPAPVATAPVTDYVQSGGAALATSTTDTSGVHAATSLAPAVGYGHDASAAQAHGRNEDVYQAPFLPSPVFSGAKFVMYALFAPGRLPTGSVRISAAAPGGELVIDVPVTKLSTVGKTLHVLAARALLRDLDEGSSHLHWRRTGTPPALRGGGDGTPHWYAGWLGRSYAAVGGAGQDRGSAWNLEPVTPPAAAVRAEMIDLGVRFGIVSTHTSFVAVERWRDGHVGSSDAPLPLPFGVAASSPPDSLPPPVPPPGGFFPLAPPPVFAFDDTCQLELAPGNLKMMSSRRECKAVAAACLLDVQQEYEDEEELCDDDDDGAEQDKGGALFSLAPPARSSLPLPSSSSSPAQPTILTSSFPDDLVAEQDFDGSFPASATVARCLGTSVDALRTAAGKALGSADAGSALIVWTSVVVLAALAKHWPSFERSWQMVAEKTRTWLVAQLQRLLAVDRPAARLALDKLVAEAAASC